jgi:hypothetical protein
VAISAACHETFGSLKVETIEAAPRENLSRIRSVGITFINFEIIV